MRREGGPLMGRNGCSKQYNARHNLLGNIVIQTHVNTLGNLTTGNAVVLPQADSANVLTLK